MHACTLTCVYTQVHCYTVIRSHVQKITKCFCVFYFIFHFIILWCGHNVCGFKQKPFLDLLTLNSYSRTRVNSKHVYATSVNLDQTPSNSPSDQGLHCLLLISIFLAQIYISKEKPRNHPFVCNRLVQINLNQPYKQVNCQKSAHIFKIIVYFLDAKMY